MHQRQRVGRLQLARHKGQIARLLLRLGERPNRAVLHRQIDLALEHAARDHIGRALGRLDAGDARVVETEQLFDAQALGARGLACHHNALEGVGAGREWRCLSTRRARQQAALCGINHHFGFDGLASAAVGDHHPGQLAGAVEQRLRRMRAGQKGYAGLQQRRIQRFLDFQRRGLVGDALAGGRVLGRIHVKLAEQLPLHTGAEHRVNFEIAMLAGQRHREGHAFHFQFTRAFRRLAQRLPAFFILAAGHADFGGYEALVPLAMENRRGKSPHFNHSPEVQLECDIFLKLHALGGSFAPLAVGQHRAADILMNRSGRFIGLVRERQ